MCDVVLKCRLTTLKFWQIAILHLFKTRVSGKLGFYFEQKSTIGVLKWNAKRTTTQYKISSLISMLSAASKTFENSVWHKWTVFWGVFWAAHFGSFLLEMDRKKQQLDLSTVISVFFITEILATKMIVCLVASKWIAIQYWRNPKTGIFRLLYIMNKSHVFSCEERQ